MRNAKKDPSTRLSSIRKSKPKSITLLRVLSKHKHLILLLALVVFHGLNNCIWLARDTYPPSCDLSLHLQNTLRYQNLIEQRSTLYELASARHELLPDLGRDPMVHYPPLMYLVALPIDYLFGELGEIWPLYLDLDLEDTAVMVNVVFMAILLFAVYGIGKTLWNKNIGLFTAFVLSMFPGVFGTSRIFFPDIALAAMVALSIYLLIRTDHFRNRKYSILFGISLGLGALTKVTYFLFVCGPLIWVVYRYYLISKNSINSIYHKSNRNSDRSSNSYFDRLSTLMPSAIRPILRLEIVSISIGLAITLIWYLRNLDKLYSDHSSYRSMTYNNLEFIYPLECFIRHPIVLFIIFWALLSGTLYFVAKNGTKNGTKGGTKAGRLRNRKLHTNMNLIGALLLGVLIASFWYLPKIDSIHSVLGVITGKQAVASAHAPPLSTIDIGYFTFYFKALAIQLSPIYFVIFLAALGCILGYVLIPKIQHLAHGFSNAGEHQGKTIKSPLSALRTYLRTYLTDTRDSIDTNDKILIFALWIIVPYFIFSLMFDKSARANLPFMPVLAFVIAAGVLKIPHPKLKTVVIVLIMIVGGLQFFGVTYNIKPLCQPPLILSEHIYRPEADCRVPIQEDWKVCDIIGFIDDDCKDIGRKVNVTLYLYDRRMNDKYFEYCILAKGASSRIELITIGEGEGATIGRLMSRSDYIVTKSSHGEFADLSLGEGDSTGGTNGHTNTNIIDEPPEGFVELFGPTPIREFELPDGGVAKIYKNIVLV